jgi:hypothetical protein
LNETWELEEDGEIQRTWRRRSFQWVRIWRTNNYLQCLCESEVETNIDLVLPSSNGSVNLKNDCEIDRLRVNRLKNSIEDSIIHNSFNKRFEDLNDFRDLNDWAEIRSIKSDTMPKKALDSAFFGLR